MPVDKPGRRRLLGRPRLRWVNNIKTGLGEIDGVVLTGLVLLKIGTIRELLLTL
jgi:hypothetical protein